MPNNEMRNSEGYYDPTAGTAEKHVLAERKVSLGCKRFRKLLNSIFELCEDSGFRVEGRITLVDKRSGRRWE